MATLDNQASLNPTPTAATGSPRPLEELDRRLKEALQQATELKPLLNQLLRIAAQAIGAPYIGFFESRPGADGEELVPTHQLAPATDTEAAQQQLSRDVAELQTLAAAAATARTVIERPLNSRPGFIGLAAPVAHPGRTPAALAVMVPPPETNGRRPLALLDHVANSLSHWQLMHTLDRLNWEASASSAAVELVNEVLASESMREAYLAAANSLKTLFACERVVMAAYHETLGKNEIQAISEMAQFDSKAETVEAMAAAMDEAVGSRRDHDLASTDTAATARHARSSSIGRGGPGGRDRDDSPGSRAEDGGRGDVRGDAGIRCTPNVDSMGFERSRRTWPRPSSPVSALSQAC